MMTERPSAVRAYNLGVLSVSNGDENPYGSTCLELRCWWSAGRADCENGHPDRSMLNFKTKQKLGVE